jgi:hypothetical protein
MSVCNMHISCACDDPAASATSSLLAWAQVRRPDAQPLGREPGQLRLIWRLRICGGGRWGSGLGGEAVCQLSGVYQGPAAGLSGGGCGRGATWLSEVCWGPAPPPLSGTHLAPTWHPAMHLPCMPLTSRHLPPLAGGLPFAIGTETWGSVTCPAMTTGATAFRPTFGKVPQRPGSMALAPSLDKAGIFCRCVFDTRVNSYSPVRC